MSEKKSHVVNCKFTNDWKNPSGKTVYYHEVELANGDKGICGTYEKYPDKLSELSEITYELTKTDQGGNKIKLLSFVIHDKDTPPPPEAKEQKKQDYKNKPKTGSYTVKAITQESMLGYSYSYAKDLLIAGKTSKDLEELKKMAEAIYNHVGDMLNKTKEG